MSKKEKDLKLLRIYAIVGSFLAIVLILFGISIAVFQLDFAFPNKRSAPWGFILVGALLLILAIAPYFDTLEKTKVQQIEEEDERNTFIRQKSGFIAYGILYALGVLTMLFLAMLGYMNTVSFFSLLFIFLLSNIVMWISTKYLQKKM